MSMFLRTISLVALLALYSLTSLAQAEDLPVSHPVYLFLKRMEVRGLIERYNDAVLPLARREVAEFLTEIDRHRDELTPEEREWLDDYISEFRYDITRRTDGLHSLVNSGDSSFVRSVAAEFSGREKYLYLSADSNMSLFLNGLLDLDYRHISGDALGRRNAEFVQFGGVMRGTILNRFGYFLQGTNAPFRGSGSLLERDPLLGPALIDGNSHNFDFTEGHLRYDSGILSAQVGREQILWGNSYDDLQKLVMSEVPGESDLIRADIRYKALKYTFVHARLNGPAGGTSFAQPADTSAMYPGPSSANKYLAAHRLELSFPRLFDIGIQEMVVYGNRSADFGYLNPFAVYASVRRSRGDGDSGFWMLDLQTHCFKDVELSASILYDDDTKPLVFGRNWDDRYAWQLGMMYVDAFAIPNTSLMAQYTRVEPYMFSRSGSTDDSYTSGGFILGPQVGPNADVWLLRGDYLPARNLFFSFRVTFERKGNNIVDASGHLRWNVGADVLQPHRESDPESVTFLDGMLVKTRRLQLLGTWEIVNQFWLDGIYMFDSQENAISGQLNENNTLEMRLRLQL